MAWRLMSWDLPDHLLVVGCAVCAVCAPIPWLGVIWKLFSQKFLKFLWFEVFSGIFFVLPIWKLLFPGVPEIFWFESCSSRTTCNGLETDELGLAGSLACPGLCCLCCLCSHSLARCHLNAIFPEISQVFVIWSFFRDFLCSSHLKVTLSRSSWIFLVWKVVLVGLLAMAWRLMSWDLPDHLLVVGCVLSVLCSHSLARCHLKAIFPENFEAFLMWSFSRDFLCSSHLKVTLSRSSWIFLVWKLF